MTISTTNQSRVLEDLIVSCHGAIYVYGVIAAYLPDPNQALDALAEFRVQRDYLLTTQSNIEFLPPPAKAAYVLDSPITDEFTARASAATLEERAVAHWAAAIAFLPQQMKQDETDFLQRCAIRSFNWSGIAKAFSSSVD